MTATGRGSKISTLHDVYPTPKWAVTRFLEEWPIASDPRQMHWLESSAGDGAIVRAVNEFRAGLGLIPIVWTVCEIRTITRPILLGLTDDVRNLDFVESPIEAIRRVNARKVVCEKNGTVYRPRYDVGIFNPPFTLTMEFFRRNRELCNEVGMLQRQNFIGSADRNKELRADMPDQYMLPDRVDFAGDGQSDAIGHSWWTWGDFGPVQRGELILLPTTHVDERSADRPRISLKRPIPLGKIKRRKKRKKRSPPSRLKPTQKIQTRKRKPRHETTAQNS